MDSSTGPPIDVLHNNVGITAMGGPVEESIESWHHVMDTNVTAMFLSVKYVLPHMLKAGKGAIVNIASLAGIRVTPYPYTSYYASKAAVVHMTTSIGLQYAKQGIRANAIAPGLMNTPMVHKQIAGQYASTEEMVKARDAIDKHLRDQFLRARCDHREVDMRRASRVRHWTD